MDSQIKIRRAISCDEVQIARVHIQSWQEAYSGIISQNYLAELPKELDERILMWTSIIKNPERWAWVAENNTGIVGFVLFGPPRDPNKEDYIELGAIYLVASEKNKKIGFSMLSAGFNFMRDLGYKKSYCWVLENNPTSEFYKRTGALLSSEVKQDEIDGKIFNEHLYYWNSLNVGDYNWNPFSISEIKLLFDQFKFDWIIAGGWAIDLFLNTQTRTHSDVDILIHRDHQNALQDFLTDWDVWVADPPGALRPVVNGEYCKKGIQDIWVRKTANDPWQFQIMLYDTQNQHWVYKRDETITQDLKKAILQNDVGIKYLAPEIQLLYKSKSLREKDVLDLDNTLGNLSLVQKKWLYDSLNKVSSGLHPWLSKIKTNLI